MSVCCVDEKLIQTMLIQKYKYKIIHIKVHQVFSDLIDHVYMHSLSTESLIISYIFMHLI